MADESEIRSDLKQKVVRAMINDVQHAPDSLTVQAGLAVLQGLASCGVTGLYAAEQALETAEAFASLLRGDSEILEWEAFDERFENVKTSAASTPTR